MKNLTAKLKGMDYKQLAIDHGEKLVVGLIGLLSLLCVLGARWAPYSRDPDELSKMVSEARTAITSVEWTDADTEKFTPTSDIRKQAKLLLTSLDGAKYEYDIPFTWPLHEQDKPYSEPDFLAVNHLMARYGRANIVFADETASTAGDGGDPEDGGFGGFAGDADDSPDDLADEDPSADPDGFATDEEDEGGGGGGSSGTAGANVQGVRYVAVVGVFPLKNQIDVLRRSMHQISSSKVAHLIVIHDSEIQRQTAIAGPNPWSGKWEPADVEFTKEVLRQANDFDFDIVEHGVINIGMTSPLPQRHVIRDKTGKQFGFWDERVSHPDLKNVELSPEEIQNAILLQNKVMEFAEARQKATRPPQLDPGAGYRDLAKDYNRAVRSVFRGKNADANAQKLKQRNPNSIKQDAIDKLKAAATATGRLLLFRYLDFAVEPGNAYRYRVRLILKNPHYGRSSDQLADPDIAVGLTRTTLWSNSTEPIICPYDTDYFLTSVETPRSRPANASIDVYEWQPEIGARVNKELPTVVGQFIGRANENAIVFNPGMMSISEEQVEFKIHDMLVDLSDGPLVKQADHPDLGLTKDLYLKELSSYSLGVVDQALIVNQFGKLVALDQVSRRRQHARAFRQQNKLFDDFNHLMAKQEKESPGDDGLDDLAEASVDDGEGGEEGGGAPSPRQRVRNSLKKKTDRRKGKSSTRPAGGPFQRYNLPAKGRKSR